MPNCTAILTTGLPCTYRARENDKCGTHKHTALITSLTHIRRRADYIYTLDERNALAGVPRMNTLPASVAAGMEHINLIEALIRPQYPGWGDRPFIRDHYRDIDRAAAPTPRRLAEQRIPAALAERHDQVTIMHGWYTSLNINLHRFMLVGAVPYVMDDLYDPDRFRLRVQPNLTAGWPRLDNDARGWFVRCAANMRILGQTHISDAIRALAGNPAPVAAPPPPDNINGFMRDPQNVHRRDTVKYVEQMFKDLKKIVVPADQKTLAEIMLHCKMRPEAEVQMVKLYHAGDSIYEHQRAYKRALDAVWAVVRKHENRAEMYVRVAEEMNDNIGMCAQGNLSRICNILAGYSDDVKPPVPQGVLVQNKMAAIAMDSEGNKVGRAKDALRELLVPEAEWGPWIEAFDE